MRWTGLLTASLFSLSLVLSGCQTALEEGTVGSGERYWSAQQQKVSTISALVERGRIGVISPQGRFSLNYVLDMTSPEEYTLTLTTTLGSTAAVFKREGSEYSLLTDGKLERGASLGELFAKRFDTGFPEADFTAIITGRAQEGLVLDEEGRPLGLNLFPYQFLYRDFAEYKGYALPSKILMRSPELELKIAVNTVERIN